MREVHGFGRSTFVQYVGVWSPDLTNEHIAHHMEAGVHGKVAQMSGSTDSASRAAFSALHSRCEVQTCACCSV